MKKCLPANKTRHICAIAEDRATFTINYYTTRSSMTIIIFFNLYHAFLQIKCSRFSEICVPSSYSPDNFPNSIRRSASPFPLDDNFLARSMIFGCTVCQMLTRSVERATASLKSALIYHTLQANIVIQYVKQF